MNRIQRCFKSLSSAGFIRILDDHQLELFSHGIAYSKLLQQQWLNLRPLAAHLGSTHKSSSDSNPHRFAFTRSPQFLTNFKKLLEDHPRKAKCPTLIKHQQSSCVLNDNSLFRVKSPGTVLTTDFLVEPYRALEHFYNMQRESKIWWMRLSSDPSRFSIVPCHLPDELDSKSYQAIDITSKYGEAGEVIVEKLSLVKMEDNEGFILPDARTGERVIPTVIRSTIDLETATIALLLDGCDHRRETQSLLLNRILAPYQCGIACLDEDSSLSDDLRDLCLHLTNVISQSGLRLCQGSDFELTKESSKLRSDYLTESDKLGVPYTLMLSNKTLKNGLLQLRSRDTMIAETIHISDVPDYLLNIFRKD
ncbi:DNA polymerase subunit gamma-2, mitochondrial [Drosophila bipectinata]|uniref:DNA polymerase subunit gamma-2, mitochondrial n=1 Tax=Drosophila bipectinata TaxID=42026 RepID=UPI001C8AB81A|nr:DNA polymerase subunit gamma-2, mitochondrial [Drosophila bipectinata]